MVPRPIGDRAGFLPGSSEGGGGVEPTCARYEPRLKYGA